MSLLRVYQPAKPRISRRTLQSAAIYSLVAILILLPSMPPGYILTLDMVAGPHGQPIEPLIFAYEAPVKGGVLPVFMLLHLFSFVMPAWLVQKMVLLGLFILAGLGAHRATEVQSEWARYYAGLLYVINPFTYVRLLAGQWLVLSAYACIPFAFLLFRDLLREPSKKALLKVLAMTSVVGWLNIHMLLLLLGLYMAVVVWSIFTANTRARIGAWGPALVALSVLFLTVNAFWLLPGYATRAESVYSSIGKADLSYFALRPGESNAVLTAASMHGFWRPGYASVADSFPFWLVFYGLILFLAVEGVRTSRRKLTTKVLVSVAVISIVLATGIRGPLGEAYARVMSLIPLSEMFRDTHKFVALLPLVYGSLGAKGISSLSIAIRDRKYQRFRTVLLVALASAVALPLLYGHPMLLSNKRLASTDYPSDWYAVEAILSKDNTDASVLVLPWHLYMDYSWLPRKDKRLANPASVFFSKPVVVQDMEFPEKYLESPNAGRRYISEHLAVGESTGTSLELGTELALMNIKYILLAKEADFDRYEYLFGRPDLELLADFPTVALFQNLQPVSRFYTIDQLDAWDSIRPIPYTALNPAHFIATVPEGKIAVFVAPTLDAASWEVKGAVIPETRRYLLISTSTDTTIEARLESFDIQVIAYWVTVAGLATIVLLWLTPVGLRVFREKRTASRQL